MLSDTEDIILVDPDAIEKAKPKTFWVEADDGEHLTDPMLWEPGMSIEVRVNKYGRFRGYRMSTGEIVSGCSRPAIMLLPGDTLKVSVFTGPCR